MDNWLDYLPQMFALQEPRAFPLSKQRRNRVRRREQSQRSRHRGWERQRSPTCRPEVKGTSRRRGLCAQGTHPGWRGDGEGSGGGGARPASHQHRSSGLRGLAGCAGVGAVGATKEGGRRGWRADSALRETQLTGDPAERCRRHHGGVGRRGWGSGT